MADFDPETVGNSEDIEKQFAVKTVEHLEAYEKLITGIPPKKLKLTQEDDEIYDDLMEKFPEFKFEANLQDLDEEKMKSAAGKEKWRSFIMPYEKTLVDYNFAVLIRKDCTKLYTQDNTILVTRVQFLALEIARNRTGLNDKVYNEAQANKSS
ncbi:hypothetical protein P7C73_g6736, partial [Tremellales sp. Uapishka_1]